MNEEEEKRRRKNPWIGKQRFRETISTK